MLLTVLAVFLGYWLQKRRATFEAIDVVGNMGGTCIQQIYCDEDGGPLPLRGQKLGPHQPIFTIPFFETFFAMQVGTVTRLSAQSVYRFCLGLALLFPPSFHSGGNASLIR